jgi:hypothetical protein
MENRVKALEELPAKPLDSDICFIEGIILLLITSD